MKIYTKTGDKGTTSLFSGGRVSKTHPRVAAYGTVDELNAVIGVARAHRPTTQTDAWLHGVQHQLFHLGADLATPLDAKAKWVVRIDTTAITGLEEVIDTMTAALPPLTNFILPGGTPAAAQLHVARTVCRRAERLVVALGEDEPINENALIYLNRLSDFLFTLSRWENMQAGEPEDKWALRD
ncbi:MAG: cob(I)yrinic acid a,c-diamide adenosyltransferase [Anaerolineaceae bacterium]|nr:cob(I)yrinic acid a,c-diamide adenosyltransferase [Anaerolineaceae bacterium]